MPVFTDQLGRKVELRNEAKRIVSLVPSQTELLYDLGLEDEVAGITKFCIHPDIWYRNKTKLGGTKKLDLKKIRALKPDLIIANKEENLKSEIESLAEDFPVWISDVKKLQDAFDMILAIGEMTGKNIKAREIQNKINENFKMLPVAETKLRTAYLVWRKPYMLAGKDTFIDDMMQHAGFENICNKLMPRYPVFWPGSFELPGDFELLKCQNILLSSEPFPFSKKHVKEFQSLCPEANIQLVDGEMFSWYGSRLIKAPAYFEQLQLQSYL